MSHIHIIIQDNSSTAGEGIANSGAAITPGVSRKRPVDAADDDEHREKRQRTQKPASTGDYDFGSDEAHQKIHEQHAVQEDNSTATKVEIEELKANVAEQRNKKRSKKAREVRARTHDDRVAEEEAKRELNRAKSGAAKATLTYQSDVENVLAAKDRHGGVATAPKTATRTEKTNGETAVVSAASESTINLSIHLRPDHAAQIGTTNQQPKIYKLATEPNILTKAWMENHGWPTPITDEILSFEGQYVDYSWRTSPTKIGTLSRVCWTLMNCPAPNLKFDFQHVKSKADAAALWTDHEHACPFCQSERKAGRAAQCFYFRLGARALELVVLPFLGNEG